jgi:hypothetical protein
VTAIAAVSSQCPANKEMYGEHELLTDARAPRLNSAGRAHVSRKKIRRRSMSESLIPGRRYIHGTSAFGARLCKPTALLALVCTGFPCDRSAQFRDFTASVCLCDRPSARPLVRSSVGADIILIGAN